MANAITVRPATHDDIDFIVDLHALEHVGAFLDSPTREQVEKAIERGTNQQIAERDGAPVALILFDYYDDWLIEFRRFAVAEPGTGVGAAVLEWLISHAFDERGAHRINLEVGAANSRARRLYERFGFSHEGTFRDGFRNHNTDTFEDLCIYGLLKTDIRPTG